MPMILMAKVFIASNKNKIKKSIIMIDLDFKNIRSIDGDQKAGFEEFVTQIAHLDKPKKCKRFIRKNGSGGDGGVECYWILEDNTEYCWQAKYFINQFSTKQWTQLDDSFNKALNCHPNMVKFFVCLPLDKTDSKRRKNNGDCVNSQEEQWKRHVDKWKIQASELNREVEIIFWGKHEFILFLSNDKLEYSGKILFWFNAPQFDFKKLEDIANRTKDNLGDRYTPEFNVKLPISEKIEGLDLNKEWWDNFIIEKNIFFETLDSFFLDFSKHEKHLMEIITLDEIYKFKKEVNEFKEILKNKLLINKFNTQLDDLMYSLKKLKKNFNSIYYDILNEKNSDKKNDLNKIDLTSYRNKIINFISIYEKKFPLLIKKTILLTGVAGSGKSHLLSDISLKKIRNKQPILFILGAHYQGGHPINFIKKALDLEQYRDAQVLSFIDSMGESYNSRFLIIIDAINEGSKRDDWKNYLYSFILDLSKYPHIALIFSCRTNYLKYMDTETIKEKVVQIEHKGFADFEHRAAEKYLSLQGIDKICTPIIAPEFTNPLFLKICCKVLKQQNKHSFPQGLTGMISLFDFYISNIEIIVSRIKKYPPKSKIILKALKNFALSLIESNNWQGINFLDAKRLINTFDPNPNLGDNFFNILIDEGVLAEDISYENNKNGEPVFRFTYERFSDYFIALELIEQVKDIDLLFTDSTYINKVIIEKGFYSISGITDSLEIIIAEKYKKEIRDLIPATYEIDKYYLDESFINTILWRTSESITYRTLEILNDLECNYTHNPTFEVLLKLSTSIEHVWNAEFLHKNLIDFNMANRDEFWSTYIALEDSSEEEGLETTARSLIEWALHCELKSVESERIRLCSITLIWFLTTPNRKMRDRATKSLVRILSYFPKLIVNLIDKFSDVDDLYLLERLYAVIYGAICNINDKAIIKSVSRKIYNIIFSEGTPIPHILLRDYARGILEYADYLKILPKEINRNLIIPVYKTNENIETVTIEEIKQLPRNEFSSDIISSLQGSPGDFGNYTMSCIHKWSSTPFSEKKIKTGYDQKIEFSNTVLDDSLKEKFLTFIKNDKNLNYYIDFTTTNEQPSDSVDNSIIEKEIINTLSVDEKEYFRWIKGLTDDREAPFSRKWAQRWVIKKAYSFGWTKQKFENFEKYYCSHGSIRMNSQGKERMGKKYQWIALHYFLALLSDNYYMLDSIYDEIKDNKYEGPWQIHFRDLDPTIWLRGSKNISSSKNNKTTWWEKFKWPIPNEDNITIKKEFLWDEKNIPNFLDLLEVSKTINSSKFFILNGFWTGRKDYNRNIGPYLDCWFRINVIIIKKGYFETLKKEIHGSNLANSTIIQTPSTDDQGYFGEYPWHPFYKYSSNWKKGYSTDIINSVEYFVPYTNYIWEYGDNDYSIDNNLNFFLPASELINDMNLYRDLDNFSEWKNNGETIFIDSRIKDNGEYYALINKNEILNWLEKNSLEIVWLIGGEKHLFEDFRFNFYGRLEFNSLYRFFDNQIKKEDEWLNKIYPRNKIN